jgi:predicted phage tail protein
METQAQEQPDMFRSQKPDSTKKTFTATLFTVLLTLVLAWSLLVNIAEADPILDMGEVPPKSTTTPPAVLILKPQNSTTTTINTWLTLKTTPPQDPNLKWANLIEVYYSASWQPNKVTVYSDDSFEFKAIWEDEVRLSGIPQGTNTLTVTAVYHGYYEPYPYPYLSADFTISGSSTVTFAVDLKPLTIEILSPYPQAYTVSDVPLTFTTNENAPRLQYCLDGQSNVTVQENSTLTGLPEGEHTITVYGFDEFGNPGTSQTITFSIETFPTSLSVAIIASAAAICFAIAAYATKHKKSKKPIMVE